MTRSDGPSIAFGSTSPVRTWMPAFPNADRVNRLPPSAYCGIERPLFPEAGVLARAVRRARFPAA